jgi:hypothetical protein
MAPMTTFFSVIAFPTSSRSSRFELFISNVITSASTWFSSSSAGLYGLHRPEHPLLRRVPPARVAPDFRLGAQAFHRVVEHLEHELGLITLST